MCGIVGYVGREQAAPILLRGLQKLEYRGYDSAGLAVYDGERIVIEKTQGRLKILDERVQGGKKLDGTMGIGHTRWATHGKPSDINSHPHASANTRFVVVHNGIIENYMEIKEFLVKKGYCFVSETDTEVIAHLVDYEYQGDMMLALSQVLYRVEGSYALGLLSVDAPDRIVAVRKDSPLVIGRGKTGNFIASDIPALLEHTRDVYLMENHEIAVLTKDSISFYNQDLEPIGKQETHVTWDVDAAEKGGYEHFMMKEIMEEPKVVADTLRPRVKDGKIVLEDVRLTADQLRAFNKIVIIACGSAYHVGLAGKYVWEDLMRVQVDVEIASEFRYRNALVDHKTLAVVISQSGETADTLAALRLAKKRGARILSVVNVVGSSIARESDDLFYTWAGLEIAVATTKAYSTQLMAMYLLGLHIAEKRGDVTAGQAVSHVEELQKLPDMLQSILENKEYLQYVASKQYNEKHMFFIGRGADYPTSMEGSLKLKEISYTHCEATAAGELKHGTIALIEDGTLVAAVVTQPALSDKMLSNIREVKARGAKVFAIVFEDDENTVKEADYVFRVPRTNPLFAASLSVLPLQLFAYYVAVLKGCDVDKPRNLAKSVTVE